MVTHPSEYDPPSSKTGSKVTPRLVVFQSPPDAVATYQTLRSRGSTATSAMRPDENVPGMLRTCRSRKRSAVRLGVDDCCAISSSESGSSHGKRFIGG